MALLWELEPADLTAALSGKVESVVLGSVTLTSTEGYGPTLADSDGLTVLRMDVPDGDADAGRLSSAVDAVAMPATGACAMMVRYPASMLTVDGNWGGFGWLVTDWTNAFFMGLRSTGSPPLPARQFGSLYTGGEFASETDASATDAAWHVWVLTWTPTTSALYMDGDLVATATDAPGDFTGALGTVMLSSSGYPSAPDLAYLAVYDAAVDVAAVSAAIAAAHVGGSPSLEALGTITWTGTATLSDVPDIPDTPVATPGGSVTPPEPPEPQDPPEGVPNSVLRRVSELMPAPTLDARGFPVNWAPTSVVDQDYARFQVVVEGVDITYYAGAPLPIPQWTRTEPFGSAEATIEVPQLTPFHALPAWCVPGANVDIRLRRLTGAILSRFAGVVSTFGHRADRGVFTLECHGVLFVDDLQLRAPAFLTTPRDIGAVIADVLTSTISRRHGAVAPVATGCLTSVLGGWEPRVTGYIQQLLSTAVTGGRQWTVKCPVRNPQIALKDTTTVSWTVSNGQRGVTVDLVQDWSQAPNVIFGEGVGSDGGRWRNAMYPGWRPDDTPAYPNSNPNQTMHLGSTDAGTTTGSGVSDWQRKVGILVTGRFTLADRASAYAVQAAAGIQFDGIVGPQTWAASFGTGSNTGTLDCFYMPLAYSPQVMPRRLGPDGANLGANTAYNPDVMRVEDKIDFGDGVGKAEGTRAAREILAREIHPGWTGTIGLTLDPEECSRYEIQEGSNGRIRYFRGGTLVVHASQVSYGESVVTATVDTNARDYPTLAAIRDRERNATDPAKAKVKRLSSGSITEARATFDAESPAGHIPRHALFVNLWTVIRIPVGSYGSIVRAELATSGSAHPFAVGIFDRPITAAGMLALVGNPLTAGSNPWSDQADALDAAGLLMSWGWAKQPAGYYPGEYSDPDGEGASPVTGRLLDDASWDYASTTPPWLWVAEIASGSCYIEGRFWQGVS